MIQATDKDGNITNSDVLRPDNMHAKDRSNPKDTGKNVKPKHGKSKNISPLNLPLINRLQTVFILCHSTSILLFVFLYFSFWCIPYVWPLMAYYTLFYYLLDRSPVNGGVWYRRSDRIRRFRCWRVLVNYFPIKFHKLVDLEPTFKDTPDTENKRIDERIGPSYIFGYHPHGVIATGVSSGFTNNGTGWDEMFPGIKCFVTTLVNQFRVPFYRDYLMALGVTTVVKKNLKLLLNKGGSVVIVVGGARESLLAKPGLNSIVLNRRKGFVKLALESLDQNGLCLVPVYGFGENDIYNVFFTDDSEANRSDDSEDDEELEFQDSGVTFGEATKKFKKFVHQFQLFLKNNFGWTLPIVISRGIFNYDFGILPYRKSINVVFGKPIRISRLNGLTFGDPVTQDEIDYWHNEYVKGLLEVWKWGKPQFSEITDEDLKIVE